MTDAFPQIKDKTELERGSVFGPRFDESGLITTVVTEAGSDQLLMVAFMNAEALTKTLETGIAHYWSRSRQSLWKKGESSGNLQHVVEMRTDCDQDVIQLRVRQDGDGAACHTGRVSCFYRVVTKAANGSTALEFDEHMQPMFDPEAVYGNKGE
ncbi:MAG: phosphoribosyl-AMP cyclohydrolase [Pseudomonadota bacterium]